MPIEIKELHIKINVSEDNQSNNSANKSPGNRSDKVIKECIEYVMDIQNRKTER